MSAHAAEGPAGSALARGLPALRALAALALAALGEGVIRSGNGSGLGLALYLAAIALFAWGAWPPPPAPEAASAPEGDLRSRLAVLGIALLGAGVLTFVEVRHLLRGAEKAAEAPWAAGILVLAAGGIAAGPVTAFTPRWSPPPLAGRLRRRLFAATVAAILGLAAATRLPALERIPYGINADEGDQAMVAIQLLRGTRDDGLFGVGWYHIGMLYFRALAAVMRFSGISVGGARVFGALCGVVTVGIVLWIGVRGFGRRAGLLAGLLAAALGPAIQFSRETTCAGPTITLWAASAAFFLEAARTGRAWAWILAGLSGGASIYFYPTGRLWGVLAALFTLGVIARGPRGIRGRLVAGTALSAAAAFAFMTPFLQRVAGNPAFFFVRARETSIFVKANPYRLAYYDSSWSTARLVAAQLEHAVGIFNRYPDGNYFWPTGKPILPPALAVLTLLGLGAGVLRARDPRLLLLSAWFGLGFVGVVVTVETPNLHRMSTAVPVLALFSALVLDDAARRTSDLAAGSPAGPGRRVAGVATGVVALVAAGLAARELAFYFGPYAASDAWPYPRVEGQTVAREGKTAWVVSLGRRFHMVNSGWVYLYAPAAPRLGVLAPGSELPLRLPPDRGLAFLIYPQDSEYVAFLEALYPGGTREHVTESPEKVMFDVYRVPAATLRRMQGALAEAPGRAPVRVDRLGDPPPGARDGSMRWTAALWVGSFWNYAFRVGPGPARLVIDGREVARASSGRPEARAVVALARGSHFVELEGEVAAGRPVTLEWKESAPAGSRETPDRPWERPSSVILRPLDRPPGGLFGVVTFERPKGPEQRLDGAIATGGFSDEIGAEGHSYQAVWTGRLDASESGAYRMSLVSEGEAELTLDGRLVVRSGLAGRDMSSADVVLAAGPHSVSLAFRSARGPGGLQWTWKPPAATETTIVPPSVLSPPPGAGIGPALPVEVLGPPENRRIEPQGTFRR